MKEYKVQFFQDNIYEVIEVNIPTPSSLDIEYEKKKVFQGTLSDCEAFINLKEKGYM